jgi:CHRD domain
MIRLTAAILFLLSSMACGSATTTAAASPSPNPASAFTMGSMNASGVTGTGQVSKGAGSFTVSIQIHGLKPSSSHISHVHIGTCAKQGNVAYALLQVIADSSGNATATTTVPEYFSMPALGWYVNVHVGPDFSEAEYAPSISCGDLPRT